MSPSDPELDAMEKVLKALGNLDSAAQGRVLGWVSSKLGAAIGAVAIQTKGSAEAKHQGKRLSLPEFVRKLQPKSGPDYVVAIGSYLEKVEGNADFSGPEIKAGFRTCKYDHSNPFDAIGKAKATGRVMDASEAGRYVLTQAGETWVESRNRSA